MKRDLEQEDSAKPTTSRPLKRKKRIEQSSAEEGDFNDELRINNSMAKMDGALFADLIARQTKRFAKNLTPLELEERRIPEAIIADCTEFEKPRIAENLPEFLEQQTKKSRDKLASLPSDEKGTPHTVVIAPAALRAADLTRALRVYQKKPGVIGKLFAKHIKLKQAIEFVKSTRINIGIGTPQRFLDLIEQGALSVDRLDHIVVDTSFINEKKRGILDMPETLQPTVKLLSSKNVTERSDGREAKPKILMF